MKPVDHRKIRDDFGRDDLGSPFATDPEAPGWVSNNNWAVFVGEKDGQRFVGGWKGPIASRVSAWGAVARSAAEVTEDLSLRIPSDEMNLGQAVWCRGRKQLVAIQFAYAPLLDGLRVVHPGKWTEPLLGLDAGGDLVAMVMGLRVWERSAKKVAAIVAELAAKR